MALVSLALFFVAVFPQALLGGKYIFTGDGFFYSYPLRTVAWAMIRHGELPLWTPYIMSGYPLLSMAQIGLAYPLTWGYLFLPGRVAEQIYVLAPFLLAPAFTFTYLRELGRSTLASLLGALTFGYGGMMASPLANNGFMTNAVMWLPLMLVAIERARRQPFVLCLLAATAAYTMSVMTGYGQGFLYVGLLAAAYASFLVLTIREGKQRSLLASITQWKPLLVACGSILLSAGVAAFQITETARAVHQSLRGNLSYDAFALGSFSPVALAGSFTTPVFYVIDMTAYVPPLAAALAVVAVLAHARQKHVIDRRVWFWLGVTLLAAVLMMGQFTPLHPLIFRVPLLNRFRIPSRHAFEWTFAVGILAAYGWDAAIAVLGKRRDWRERTRAHTFLSITLVAALVFVGVLWYQKIQSIGIARSPSMFAPVTVYTLWKAAFLLLTLAVAWRVTLISQPRMRFAGLLGCMLIMCYVEPSALLARWWNRSGLSASRFATASDATRFLQQFPPEQNRIFTRVDLFSEQYALPPRLDGANLSAVWKLHNVAGYDPLILERYSRALGDVGMDTVRTPVEYKLSGELFTERSHVLDLLNTTYVVSYLGFQPAFEPPLIGTMPAAADPIGELSPGTTRTLNGAPTEMGALVLVTALSNSVNEPDGAVVAKLQIFSEKGQVIERDLQAGRDTAEWAHDRPDVRAVVRHKLAPVFDQQQIGGPQAFPAYRFQTRMRLDPPTRVVRVEIRNVSGAASLGIFSAKLVSPDGRREVALTNAPSQIWQPVHDGNETLILRNTRACPRAWLVGEAEAVDSEEALRRIRGESAHEFDPRRTALLEVKPDELPQLPGGDLPAQGSARITSYEPTRLQIETSAPTPTVLVVSEIFYPGWEARIDGHEGRINVADYLLRGVTLPAGMHRIEMRYVAPAARLGAIISGLTVALLVGLAVYAWRIWLRGRRELGRAL